MSGKKGFLVGTLVGWGLAAAVGSRRGLHIFYLIIISYLLMSGHLPYPLRHAAPLASVTTFEPDCVKAASTGCTWTLPK